MNYKFEDTVSLVKFIMNRVPLITAEASDPEYKRLHPYTCSSYDEFLACNVGKQKYFEVIFHKNSMQYNTKLKNKIKQH